MSTFAQAGISFIPNDPGSCTPHRFHLATAQAPISARPYLARMAHIRFSRKEIL
jgi:hypothetical protein